MDRLTVHVSKPYDVIIGDGLLDDIRELSAPFLEGKRALVVSGSNVAPIYGKRIAGSLGSDIFIHETGETSKSFNTLEALVSYMTDIGLRRDDCIVAVGGGVTGDLAAMAASIYMRGIGCIQIPTSLLAAVDSSVGGKTAINNAGHKNIAGTFYQPSLVIVDRNCFDTLDRRIFNEGMAEVIKCSYILGEDLRYDENMIYKCLDLKRRLVEADEFDRNERMLLNFGHTIGHAVEALKGFSILHGEAVAVGMAYMCRQFSDDYVLMEEFLRSFDLPISTDIPMVDIINEIKLDKKNGKMVIPYRFGDVRVEEMDLCKLT